jgi:hypothetical protein
MKEEDLRVMGDQAQVNAAKFSLEKMCEKTLAVYEELLGQESASSCGLNQALRNCIFFGTIE